MDYSTGKNRVKKIVIVELIIQKKTPQKSQ
jgi:hypothetical protein